MDQEEDHCLQQSFPGKASMVHAEEGIFDDLCLTRAANLYCLDNVHIPQHGPGVSVSSQKLQRFVKGGCSRDGGNSGSSPLLPFNHVSTVASTAVPPGPEKMFETYRVQQPAAELRQSTAWIFGALHTNWSAEPKTG